MTTADDPPLPPRRRLAVLASSPGRLARRRPACAISRESRPSPTRRARSSSRRPRASRSRTDSRSRSCPTARCRRRSCASRSGSGNANEPDEARPGSPTSRATSSSRARRRAARAGSRRTPPRWAARSPSNAGEDAHDASAARSSPSSRPAWSSSWPTSPGTRRSRSPSSPASRRTSSAASRSRRASPADGRRRRSARRCTPASPYGRIFPAPEAIQGATRSRTRRRSGRGALSAPTVRTLYVVGVFDAKATEAAIRTAFDGWGKATAPAAAAPNRVARSAAHASSTGRAPRSPRSCSGCPSSIRRAPTTSRSSSTNALLGGSFGSRITSNIREQKGYTYSPFSQVSVRRQGAFWVRDRGRHDERHGRLDQGDLRRDRPPAGRAALRGRAQGHPELPRGHVRPPELLARRHREPAPVPRAPRPAGLVPLGLRRARPRRHARGGHAHREDVHPPGRDDSRRRRRPQGHRRAAQALRAGAAALTADARCLSAR